MAIHFSCPMCGHATDVADQYAGMTGPCAKCGATITVPRPMQTYAPPAKSGSSGWIVAIAAVVGISLLCIIGIGALLIPAVMAGRTAARSAATRMQSSNNLKQIALAMHNYHDVHQCFPPAVVNDAQGKPMHSWRVLILPYMGEAGLYQQYDFTKPWNDPANQRLLAQMPICYSDPSRAAAPGQTGYLAITGPGTAFPPGAPGKFSSLPMGTSVTPFVAEAKTTVNWLEPADLDLSTMSMVVNDPLSPNCVGGANPSGANVSFADGSVQFIPSGNTISASPIQLGPTPVPQY